MKIKRLSIVLFLVLTLFITGCQTPSDIPNQPIKQGRLQQHESILNKHESDLSIRYAKGKNGVVSTANPIASKIGIEILKKGGNAVDAAVAASFAIGLVEPNAAGIGGSGYMLVYNNKTRKQVFYDYMETAPSAINYDIWLELYSKYEESQNTVKNACIPGAVDGWLTALEDNGTMTPTQILETVIKVAEEGFKVTPHLAEIFSQSLDSLKLHAETAKVLTKEGVSYKEGEVFKNPDYAKVLKKIANEGRDGFYKGEIAQTIVESVNKNGGYFSMEDMANYKTKKRNPIKTTYRDFEVLTAAPSSTGGVPIIETLNILENFELSKLKPDSTGYIHLVSQALFIANNDRYYHVGDPDFNDDSAVLLSKSYAKARAKQIDRTKALQNIPQLDAKDFESHSTTHISVVDKYGNMVSVTNTVGHHFGCKVIPKGTGFVLNDHLFNFSKSYKTNLVKPGKRPRSTMAPVLILKDEKPYATIGTPGGSRIPDTMVQIITHLIDHNMDLLDVIDYPRIHMWKKMPLTIESRISKDVQEKLKNMGYKIDFKKDMDSYFGGVQGIIINQKSNQKYGVADKRRDGKALAY
ncbi:gamma-glutamyltransferase [Clostridiaceae bacterium M8S5]|nr:gamma-glutamyltransferase [Clostridiaceae bacterium M8S5]